MPDRLTLGPPPLWRGAPVNLGERRESDIDDRLCYPIDSGEEDSYGSSWRRDSDGRRDRSRERLAAGEGPAEPGNYRWAVEHERHGIGSAGLRVDAAQHCATYTVGLFVPGVRGQGLGRAITRLVLAWACGVHRVELLPGGHPPPGRALPRRLEGLHPDGHHPARLRIRSLRHSSQWPGSRLT